MCNTEVSIFLQDLLVHLVMWTHKALHAAGLTCVFSYVDSQSITRSRTGLCIQLCGLVKHYTQQDWLVYSVMWTHKALHAARLTCVFSYVDSQSITRSKTGLCIQLCGLTKHYTQQD